MNFNYGYERRVFDKEQAKLRKLYLAAGMSEEAIREMYAFDKAYFNLRRKEILHEAEPQEMITSDADTGEIRRMDMDDFPARETNTEYSLENYSWIEAIQNKQLHEALTSMPDDYIEIITLMMEGHSQTDIGNSRGLTRKAINNKVARIRAILKKVI